jgi:hypothetical protein
MKQNPAAKILLWRRVATHIAKVTVYLFEAPDTGIRGCASSSWAVRLTGSWDSRLFPFMARLRHAVMSEMSPLLDEQRTTFARGELFRV